MENREQVPQSKIAFFWEVVKVVVISLAIIIPVRYFLIQPFYVKGASMEPNFKEYDYLIINEVGYRFHPPQRGDVVVLRNPQRPSQFFIKRVIGLPGETIEIRQGKVYITDKELNESSYLDPSVQTWGNAKAILEENEYYVLGDNRDESLDSRTFGPIRPESIIGRAWIRAWPLTQIDHFISVPYNN